MEEENLNLNEGQEGAVDSQTEVNETEQAISTESVNDGVATSQQNEKPVQSAEENAKFAQVRRDAEQKAYAKAQDDVIEKMYGASHGIHTFAEYEAARAKQEQEQELQELLAKNIPEEYATEMLESRKLREQLKAEQETKQQQEKQQQDMRDFIKEFPDVKPEDIPVEVWQANERGIPLRYAYAEHAYKMAKKAEEVAKANTENARSSTGSVNTNGAANDSDFVSFDSYEQNKNNQSWVNKNFDKIMKSRAKW